LAGRSTHGRPLLDVSLYLHPGGDPGRLERPSGAACTWCQDEGSPVVAAGDDACRVDGPRHRPMVETDGPKAGGPKTAACLAAPSPPDRCEGHRDRAPPQEPRFVGKQPRMPVEVLRVAAATPGSTLRSGRSSTRVHRARRRCGRTAEPAGAGTRRCATNWSAERELLASAIRLNVTGGVVLYATCSPHPCRNARQGRPPTRCAATATGHGQRMLFDTLTILVTVLRAALGHKGTARTRVRPALKSLK